MTKRAAVLLPAQLRHLLQVTEATSRHPERDAGILWLGPLSKARAHTTKANTINYLSSRLDCTLNSALALRRLLVAECLADVLT